MLDKLFSKNKNAGKSAISDEDMLKYTGKTKAEVVEWAKDRPDVAGNQSCATVGAGPAGGGGLTGWGPIAKAKFPPTPTAKKELDDESD